MAFMYLHPPSATNSDVYIFGEVTVAQSAVLAPGVILQAAPDSRIIIGAGVCVGMGTILKAYGGAIQIEDGAVLGAGVLMIGYGQIGSNACIGAATTIYNGSVDAKVMIPAGTMIGDVSRQTEVSVATVENQAHSTSSETELLDKGSSQPQEADNGHSADSSALEPATPVVGQVYVNKLLFTLFPHRNSLSHRSNNPQ